MKLELRMKVSSKILWLILILAVACNNKPNETTEEELPKNLIERIKLSDLEGNDIRLSDFKGKTVFLNYWATWCRPCISEMPDIDKAAQILSSENFIFLAASDEEIEKVKKFIEPYNYSFQFVHSETSVFDLDIMALPTTMIINKEGKIVFNEVGARNWHDESELNRLRSFAKQ